MGRGITEKKRESIVGNSLRDPQEFGLLFYFGSGAGARTPIS